MADIETTTNPPPFPNFLLGFTGRIGPARYFAGIAIAIALLVAAFGFAASVMAPTEGSNAVWLAIPLFGLFIWIVAAVMAQRLRDAGKPPMLAPVLILGPILLLFPGLELIEYAGALMALIFVAFLVAPGLLKPKANDEVAAPK